MPKPMPADTWNNLFYPPADYKYFENAGQFDFEPNAPGFSWKNAWWLADSALLAYLKDWKAVTDNLSRARFDEMRQIGLDPNQSTKGFFASRSGPVPFAVVAFRGTDKDDERNIQSDADAMLVPRDGYLIHRGFDRALDQVWRSEVEPLVTTFIAKFPAAWIYFTGHSLGAALATAAVAHFSGSNCPLYTIGSPRVGDVNFVHAVLKKTSLVFRFVNSQDIVTLVPPEVPLPHSYRHVAPDKYFDRHASVHDHPSEIDKAIDMAQGILAHDGPHALIKIGDPLDYFVRVWTTGPFVDPPPYIVGNHSPARYPTLIWNSFSGH